MKSAKYTPTTILHCMVPHPYFGQLDDEYLFIEHACTILHVHVCAKKGISKIYNIRRSHCIIYRMLFINAAK